MGEEKFLFLFSFFPFFFFSPVNLVLQNSVSIRGRCPGNPKTKRNETITERDEGGARTVRCRQTTTPIDVRSRNTWNDQTKTWWEREAYLGSINYLINR
ncbi:hypothetical protein F4775DRAFT_128224 [Biscogniauxia sp. FL1348]|nr:hypothetical protein F4775DRAFT_128224 [Biscogniauxia sp. FL1348]